jgi:tetratricopeptide (TPR) repeat protein
VSQIPPSPAPPQAAAAPPRATPPDKGPAIQPPSSRMRAALVAGLMTVAGCAVAAPASQAAPAAEIPALEARVQDAPADVSAAVRLGAAYREAGRLDDARRVLEQAHGRAPGDDGATVYLGLTYEDQGELQRARELYEAYARSGASRQLRGELRGRLAVLERRAREADVRQTVAREAELADTPPRPNSVAVFPFRFAGEDPALRPLERALAEFLAADLAVSGRLHVLERARVQQLLDEIGLAQAGRVDPATAARGGRLLGAASVVQGHIGGTERSLELEVRVARITPGGASPAGGPLAERGGAGGLFEMQKGLALAIHQRLGVELTPAERERVMRRPTENLQAVLAYGRGLEAADAGDFAQAAEHFMQATTMDPGFAAAAQQAQASSGAARAAGTTTAQLARMARAELSQPADPLAGVQMLVPGAGRRDPAVEALGQEGFRDATARVELIFRRP